MAPGMLPSALDLSAGGELRSPMGIVVIRYRLFSMFLSLVFLPALFAVMDDTGRLTPFGRFNEAGGEPDAPSQVKGHG